MNKQAWLQVSAVTCLALGSTLGGCSKSDASEAREPVAASETSGNAQEDLIAPAQPIENTPPPSYGTFAPGSTAANDANAAGNPNQTQAGAPQALTDEQIAKITEVVDSGELEQAQVAKKRAKNARVKQYASHMITQHQASKRKNTKLVKQEKIEPSESDTSKSLADEGQRTLATLKDSESFDSDYIAAQVKQHQAVCELIDDRLIPNAASPELKSRLEETRAMVEKHLNEAKDIQSSMASAETVKSAEQSQ